MIYSIYCSDGARLKMEADYIKADGSGTTLFKNDGGVVAFFYCGEATRVFPELANVEAEVIPNEEEDEPE